MQTETPKEPAVVAKVGLFGLCSLVGCLTALILQFTGFVERMELQSINRMFEARPFLTWSAEGLSRLNPNTLWNYHQQHEIPRTPWAWDYTLSWVISDNHPTVKHKFVIFNHMLEDEPPPEAIATHPWMAPLLRYPISRSTVADSVRFLAQNGAKLIILDNDFPQYSPEDAVLAQAIHDCSSGKLGGKPVPVLMASTVNRRIFSGGFQLDAMTMPQGILAELRKLEPGVDVESKYTGLTTILLDGDQVVRRIATRLPDIEADRKSVTIKALEAMGEKPPENVPQYMDIDFASVPNSELYPVRPFSYLLDPERRKEISSNISGDVSIKDRVVLLGDSVQDVYPTPLTNVGVNLMSGSEILAHSIDTLSRGSWPHRLNEPLQALYSIVCCLIAAAIFAACRNLKLISQWSISSRTAFDWAFCVVLSSAVYVTGFALFAYAGLIVPVIVPSLAVAAGSLAAVMFEREGERIQAMINRIRMMEAQLEAEREMHQSQLRLQAAEAQAQQIANEHQQRREFVRRLNHDLKAPVTVLNWTLAKLKREGLQAPTAGERLDNIERTSDRLFSLIAELVRSYDKQTQETTIAADQPKTEMTDLCMILNQCAQMQDSVADMTGSHITVDLPPYPMMTTCSKLHLARIVDNLVRNAVLHNPPGTAIEISARTRANVHQVAIADNGSGIAAANLPNIFDAGFTTSEKDAGEGLGLSIVKTLIERMGGTITVESEEDLGTTFTLNIPASIAAIPEIVDPAAPQDLSLATTHRG